MCCIAPAAATLLKRALPTNKLQDFQKDLSVACGPWQDTHAQGSVSGCVFPCDKSSRVQLWQKLSVACGEHGVICKHSFQL